MKTFSNAKPGESLGGSSHDRGSDGGHLGIGLLQQVANLTTLQLLGITPGLEVDLLISSQTEQEKSG